MDLKDIILIIFGALGGSASILQAVTHFLDRRDRPRKILRWLKPSFTRVQSTAQLPTEFDGQNLSFDKENHEMLFLCEIRFRNSGKAPLTKQSVLIEFDPDANILDARVSEKIPEKEFGDISEDRKARSRSQRRFRIALMNPDNSVTFRFLVGNPGYVRIFAKSEGLEIKGPECTFVDEPPTDIASRVISDQLKNSVVTLLIISAVFFFEVPSSVLGASVPTIVGFIVFKYFASKRNIGSALSDKNTLEFLMSVLFVGGLLSFPILVGLWDFSVIEFGIGVVIAFPLGALAIRLQISYEESAKILGEAAANQLSSKTRKLTELSTMASNTLVLLLAFVFSIPLGRAFVRLGLNDLVASIGSLLLIVFVFLTTVLPLLVWPRCWNRVPQELAPLERMKVYGRGLGNTSSYWITRVVKLVWRTRKS